MNWLIEPEVFQTDSRPLIAALKKLGIKYTDVRFGTPYPETLASLGTEPTVYHGSLQFAKLIKNTPNHNVKVYCTLPKYECVYYYPRLGKYLLNSDYVMIPFGDLARRKSWPFKVLGQNSLFFRPSSGYKTFTGLVLTEDELVKEMPFWKRNVDPEALIIAAPVQAVDKEWRVVIVGKKVITAGQYAENGNSVRNSDVPEKVLAFAQEVADSGYNPDPAWTIDVGETAGELKVVEVGSFSCAGLYACDCEAIITAVNKISELGEPVVARPV